MKLNVVKSSPSPKFDDFGQRLRFGSWYPVTVSCPIPATPLSDGALRTAIRDSANSSDYKAAIVLLSQLLSRHPNSASDYNNRGLMYLKRGNYQRALDDFNRAIALDPHLDRAYNNRANCHAALGNLAAALEDYDIALDFNPCNVRAWINQGITFRELGLYDLSLDNFEFALLLESKLQGRLYAERGYTYHLRGDWNCAMADYQRALAAFPSGDPQRGKVELWRDRLLAHLQN